MFFFFNDTATTEIYTLSLHDALPIFVQRADEPAQRRVATEVGVDREEVARVVLVVRGRREDGGQVDRVDREDRKSTRLNSSHANISYAVFCLKKKKKKN